MFRKIFKNRKCRNREDPLFAHQPHRLIAQLIGVIDRRHSRLRCKQRSRLARRMYRHARPNSRRLLHRRAQLSLRVLIRRRELAILYHVRTSLINLGEVRALLILLAHHRYQLICIIRVIRIRQNMLRGIEPDRVLMPAQDVDRIPADPHPRPRNQPLINRITHRRIRRPRTLGPHIALSRKPAIKSSRAASSA